MNLAISAAIVLCVSVSLVYAQDYYEPASRTLTHDPLVCAVRPAEMPSSDWTDLMSYTLGAVLDWENKLKSETRHQDAWNLDYRFVAEVPAPDECNIVIEFLPKPTDPEDEFEVAGYAQMLDYDDIRIMIYYLDIEFERLAYSEPAPGGHYNIIEWIPSYADYMASDVKLKMVLKHELGHALGLGHYNTTDQSRLDSWLDGASRPPSAMIPIQPTKIISADIMPLDIDMLVELYGREGFGAADVPQAGLPSWIRGNAGLWADGQIDDATFVAGIQYMIQNEIIVISGLPQNSSSDVSPIPSWVKSNAQLWFEGVISDQEFLGGIRYMVENGIIRV